MNLQWLLFNSRSFSLTKLHIWSDIWSEFVGTRSPFSSNSNASFKLYLRSVNELFIKLTREGFPVKYSRKSRPLMVSVVGTWTWSPSRVSWGCNGLSPITNLFGPTCCIGSLILKKLIYLYIVYMIVYILLYSLKLCVVF